MQQTTAIRLLGTPLAPRPSGTRSPLPPMPQAGFRLLVVLADADPDPVPRKVVAALLWPDATPSQAGAALRQTLRRLALAMPDTPGLVADHLGGLCLGRPDLVDMASLLSAIRQGCDPAMIAALLASKGPPLDGEPFGNDPFNQWLATCRIRFAHSVANAGKALVDRLTRYGHADPALVQDLADRLIALAPADKALPGAMAKALLHLGATDRAKRFLPPGAAATPRVPLPSAPQAAPQMPPGTTLVPRLALFCPKAEDQRSPSAILAKRLVAELASGLAAWRSFAVLAPQSSFAVPDDFGRPGDNSRLRADYTLSGTLRDGDPGGEMTLTLTHLATGQILWSARASLAEIAVGQSLDRLTARLVSAVASTYERHERKLRSLTSTPSALLGYLEGRAHQARCDLPHVRRARSSFARALMADDRFAPAHARIAETLFVEWILCGGSDGALLSAARARADLALDLDPAGAVSHWVRGAVALYQRQFDQVTERFAEAESLAPHDADMLLEYADALSHLGAHAEAEAKFQKALDLNPIPPDKLWWVGASLAFHAENFTEAAARFDQMRDAEIAVGLRAATYALAGRLPEARLWSRRLKQVLPGLTANDLSAISPNLHDETYRKAYSEGLRLATNPVSQEE
jgi:DNA-binding SARP family transcriptional activator/tetratricopeptide (TPR) repeat protein/TolB-like protein